MKKLIIVLTVIVALCVVPLSVSAQGSNNITFFDFDEYSTYSYNSNTGLITANIQLPLSWRYSYAKDGDGFMQWFNSFDFTTVEMFDPVWIDFCPFGRSQYENIVNHTITSYTNFFDLAYIPSGAKLNIMLDTQFYGGTYLSNFANIFVGYVDSTGKVISHVTVMSSLSTEQLNDGTAYHVSGVHTFNNIPSDAVGFFYVVHITPSFDGFREIPVVTISSNLSFNYSEISYNIQQNQIIRDKLSNIDKQIGDLINSPVEPDSPEGKDDFDDLHSNEEELLNQSQIYLDNSLIYFENASDVIFSLVNGFQAINILTQPVFALPFANSLISVSISLGLIATLIGIVIDSISNGKSEEKSAKRGEKSAKRGNKAGKGG